MNILLSIGLLVGAAYAGAMWQKSQDKKACPSLEQKSTTQQTQTATETPKDTGATSKPV